MGSATQAEESLREAERLACADGDEWVQTHARLADGQRLLTTGATTEAASRLADAETAARSLGSPFTLATVLNVEATLSVLSGDDASARSRYLEAVRLSAQVRTTWTLVYALPGLATVAARAGQDELAVALFAAGATTSDAASVVVAFPPDLAHAEVARAGARERLGEKAFRRAWDEGRRLRLEDLPELGAGVRPRRGPS